MKTSSLNLLHNKAALSIKAITIILATVAIYFQDLVIVANEAIRSELMSYILAIPFLLTYLLHRKSSKLPCVPRTQASRF